MFQQSKDRALTTDIPKIVKSIQNSAAVVVEKVKEAEREAEIRRREWEEQQERRRQEEDRRRVAESNKESREQLSKAIGSLQESRNVYRICQKSSGQKC